ncbi:unnamed protein product [Chironomus riparius]|uniref:Uncharacterized protein n=1 Tax=Chironomus riparius TaxID=315576 RepID=A0A9P0IMS9_9DIPT|nr:unnamed protein product [Chironomus riparius]
MKSTKHCLIQFISFIQANADLAAEIKTFRTQTLNTIQNQFNNLFNDVYGHFHRSQNTLTGARQNLYSAASTFPYFRLTAENRQNLTGVLSALVYNIIDPTIEAVQKSAMTKFYAYNSDTQTVTEEAFLAVDTQLNALSTLAPNCTTGVTSRKLTAEYSNYTNGINNCTRFVFQKFRDPINEFTREHFVALPLINRIVRDLNQCTGGLNSNRIETCVTNFDNTYCQEDTCKVNPTILAVKDQAETMIVNGRTLYDTCLSGLSSQLPSKPSFLTNENCVLGF